MVCGALCFLLVSCTTSWAFLKQEESPVPATTDIADVTDEFREECISYIRDQGAMPNEYLVSKFASHDVIILGETHHIRENCRFIARSLAPLYHQAGVRVW